MRLTIQNRTRSTLVINDRLRSVEPAAQRIYDLSIEELEQAQPTLQALEAAGAITWSTVQDPTADDRAEGATVSLLGGGVGTGGLVWPLGTPWSDMITALATAGDAAILLVEGDPSGVPRQITGKPDGAGGYLGQDFSHVIFVGEASNFSAGNTVTVELGLGATLNPGVLRSRDIMWAPLFPDIVSGPTAAYDVDLDGGGITPPGPLGGGSVFRAATSNGVNTMRLRNGAIIDGSNLALTDECISRIRPAFSGEVVLTIVSYGGRIGPRSFINFVPPVPAFPFPLPVSVNGIVFVEMDAKTTIAPDYQAAFSTPPPHSNVIVMTEPSKRDASSFVSYDDSSPPSLGVDSVQAAIDALKALAAGASWTYLFDQLAAEDPTKNVYASWDNLCAAILALPPGAHPYIEFQRNFTIPLAGMPGQGWYLASGMLGSRTFVTGAVTVTIEDGAKLDSLGGWGNGLTLVFAPSVITDTLNWTSLAAQQPGEPWVVFISKGAAYDSIGTVPPITGPGTGQYLVVATSEATLRAGPPPAQALVNVTGADILIESEQFSGYFGSLPDGWVVGNGNLVRQIGLDTQISLIPGFTGTIVLTSTAKTQADRVLYDDTLVTPPTLGVTDTQAAIDALKVRVAPLNYNWNLNGMLSVQPLQPGSFDGMLTSNLALLGPGPFDGTRVVQVASTITLSGFVLRVSAGPVTFVEIYRIRAGLVASLVVIGLGATGSAFSGVSTVPPIVDLLPGDLLFVAMSAAPVGAEDLSVYLQTVSP